MALAAFIKVPADANWTVGKVMPDLDDEKIAKFVAITMEEKGIGPSLKKTTLAAINYQLQVNEQPNIYAFKHEYPKTGKVLDAWDVALKENPWL